MYLLLTATVVLGPLCSRSQGQKNLANFEHFWVANWPQVTNKCYNIDVMILINAGTLTQAVTNWPPKFDGILLSALGPIQGHKVQHLLVTWGRLKSSFLCGHWRDAKYPKRALSGAGFGPDSAPLQ